MIKGVFTKVTSDLNNFHRMDKENSVAFVYDTTAPWIIITNIPNALVSHATIQTTTMNPTALAALATTATAPTKPQQLYQQPMLHQFQ